MEENRKNARIFYLTLSIVLLVSIIMIVAIAVAKRSQSQVQETPQESSSSIEESSDDTKTGKEKEDVSFILPTSSEIAVDFSDTIQVFSPTMGDYRTHCGIDFLAELGSDVKAVADGVVTNITSDDFMGTQITIEHAGNVVSVYKNLAPEIASGIVIGSTVKSGDVIGTVGESAQNEIATEPHLHYELKINGKTVNPREKLPIPEQKTTEQ